ncbi:hypothetical protein OHS33_16920 [Streptomyces sp. NBC_00536]|uniref:hypothetical protein n=1 Tax=Streptomyces sp. NBC_00536 TaxID=2975769 RepID=UPI002E81DB3A|nr:hypothetical protein [Streptomyces sp. NBC_00536]WUC79866.1 hypothetical protein OHS33_16920 [Streptomyces sp. NBC_00536]
MNDQVNRFGGTHEEDPGHRARDFAPDELRGLLHGAVAELTPSDGALERLRHAVPVRRARKRQAVIGAAAAVLLCGTAVPAAMRLTAAESTPGEHSAMAGHGTAAEGKPGGASDPHAAGAGEAPQSPQPPAHGQGVGAGGTGSTPQPGAPTPSAGAGTGPAATGAATGGGPLLPPAAPGLPGCGEAQLGVRAGARTAEADGKVYGSFRVTNVSAAGCTVTGADTVTAAPASGAATGKPAVTVLAHTAGDPATGLPNPAVEAPGLVLQPAMGYEVRFAWVPEAACTGGGAADPGGKPPQGGGAQAQGAQSDAGSGAAVEPSAGPTPPSPGVEVTHTAQAGAPVTTTTIPTAACGGTLYRTGVIPLDATPKP